MSARLLKHDGPLAVQPFAAFAPPEQEGEFPAGGLLSGVTNTDPESHGARIIEQAYAKAARIESEAHTRIEATIRAEVESQIVNVINPWREELVKTLDELSTLRATLYQQTESELVRLALEIAKKVIHLEVRSNDRVALGLARAALSRVPNRTPATIHLNPDDLTYVEANQHLLPSSHVLTFIEDKAIARGGCVVHTEMGEIDASIEQQYAEIEGALIEN